MQTQHDKPPQPVALLTLGRRQRSIDLTTDADRSADQTNASFHRTTRKQSADSAEIIERKRDGDFLIITSRKARFVDYGCGKREFTTSKIQTVPAIVHIDWIKSHALIEPDDHASRPWEDGDGWEHGQIKPADFGGDSEDMYQARGWSRDARAVLTINAYSYAGDSQENRINYLRMKGASKQTARERVAAEDRYYLDQLVEWYKEYECWVTSISVSIAGIDYAEHCGGIDSEEYAETGMVDELAAGVAHAMEEDGFTVIGTDAENRQETYRQAMLRHHKLRIKENVDKFNWHHAVSRRRPARLRRR